MGIHFHCACTLNTEKLEHIPWCVHRCTGSDEQGKQDIHKKQTSQTNQESALKLTGQHLTTLTHVHQNRDNIDCPHIGHLTPQKLQAMELAKNVKRTSTNNGHTLNKKELSTCRRPHQLESLMPHLCPRKVRFGHISSWGSPVGQGNIGDDVESQTSVVENLPCTCHCRGRQRTLPLLLRPCLQERTDRKRQLSTSF